MHRLQPKLLEYIMFSYSKRADPLGSSSLNSNPIFLQCIPIALLFEFINDVIGWCGHDQWRIELNATLLFSKFTNI